MSWCIKYDVVKPYATLRHLMATYDTLRLLLVHTTHCGGVSICGLRTWLLLTAAISAGPSKAIAQMVNDYFAAVCLGSPRSLIVCNGKTSAMKPTFAIVNPVVAKTWAMALCQHKLQPQTITAFISGICLHSNSVSVH